MDIKIVDTRAHLYFCQHLCTSMTVNVLHMDAFHITMPIYSFTLSCFQPSLMEEWAVMRRDLQGQETAPLSQNGCSVSCYFASAVTTGSSAATLLADPAKLAVLG